MELRVKRRCVFLPDKVLSSLDEFVIKFVKILEEEGIEYALVSGYVAILFGRSRTSEDVDLIMEKISFDQFKKFWLSAAKIFECVNVASPLEAYKEYLLKDTSVRFSKKGCFIPNIEVKFPKTEVDDWTIKKRLKVSLNKDVVYVSPIELQIPYKLYLGSEKDIEDAKHLYTVFKDKLDIELLEGFNRRLKTTNLFNEYLK